MGLTIRVNDFDEFDIGYMGFSSFRMDLAEKYNPRLKDLYFRWIFGRCPNIANPLTNEEFEEMKNIAGDLMIFLAHSDCGGIFTPSESRKIYKCIENLTMDFEIEEYHCQEKFNVLEKLKSMFYHSWKNRRRIIFS